MKLFSNVNTDETLRAAASLAAYAGSVIGSVFSDVFENGDTRLYPVENYVYEDSLGLCGWIHSQRVLLGSRELMRAHNIEGLPSRAREAEMVGPNQEAVYLSVSGNLSAIFLVELRADRLLSQSFRRCRIEGSVDFIFGCGAAFFEDCEIVSVFDGRDHGYVAAPAHSLSQTEGFTFRRCDFTREADVADGTIFLARPWRDYGLCRFEDCRYDRHIRAEGFDPWRDSGRDKTARFFETPTVPGRVNWCNPQAEA